MNVSSSSDDEVSPPKKKRASYSDIVQYKLKVVAAAVGISGVDMQERTGIDRRTIGAWIANKAKLEATASKRTSMRVQKPGVCAFPDLEVELFASVRAQRGQIVRYWNQHPT